MKVVEGKFKEKRLSHLPEAESPANIISLGEFFRKKKFFPKKLPQKENYLAAQNEGVCVKTKILQNFTFYFNI